MTDCKNLPPWAISCKGASRACYACGRISSIAVHGLHVRTCEKHSDMKTQELETRAHELWTEKQAQRSIRRNTEGPRMPCTACAQGVPI